MGVFFILVIIEAKVKVRKYQSQKTDMNPESKTNQLEQREMNWLKQRETNQLEQREII